MLATPAISRSAHHVLVSRDRSPKAHHDIPQTRYTTPYACDALQMGMQHENHMESA